jgi:DNA excision repair protein ERCC-3
LVGPKLYEANWINLTDQGYLARVECNEVWCPMLPDFFREYISTTDARYQRLLYGLNPRKLRTCAYLVDRHRRRQDKVLIFSDDIPVLRLYCKQLACEYIDGSTPMKERQRLLDEFRTKRENNVLGLSRVGDIALDLPEANIIIQVSSQFGSNRQEAQRLGRVLRPKPGSSIDGSGGTAIFYSLVSKNTKDMYFASKRQKYLLDQGYTFHINKQISEDAELSPNVTVCREKLHEGNLLSYCKNADKSLDKVDDDAIAKENENSDDDDGAGDESSAFSVNKRSLNSFS